MKIDTWQDVFNRLREKSEEIPKKIQEKKNEIAELRKRQENIQQVMYYIKKKWYDKAMEIIKNNQP